MSNKPTISFIIQRPSPDLDTEDYNGPKYYIRGAVHNVQNLLCEGFKVPTRIIKFLQQSFDDGNFRAEILDGDILYKVYRQPSAEQWPRNESGTPLERFQREQRDDVDKYLDKTLKSGAGSQPITAKDDDGSQEVTISRTEDRDDGLVLPGVHIGELDDIGFNNLSTGQ